MGQTEIGTLVKTLRVKKGYSLRELSKLSTVSYSEISRIENGERVTPTPKILNKLSAPLGISYEKLLAVAGHIPRHEILAAHDPNKYESITPEMHAEIRRLVNEALEDNKRKG